MYDKTHALRSILSFAVLRRFRWYISLDCRRQNHPRPLFHSRKRESILGLLSYLPSWNAGDTDYGMLYRIPSGALAYYVLVDDAIARSRLNADRNILGRDRI